MPLKQRFSLGYELPYESSPMLGKGSFGQPGMPMQALFLDGFRGLMR